MTDDIQRDPLKYLQQVEAGETLVIFRLDKPIAELKPVAVSKQLRPFGLCIVEFTVPDDFDAPLPEDLLIATQVPEPRTLVGPGAIALLAPRLQRSRGQAKSV